MARHLHYTGRSQARLPHHAASSCQLLRSASMKTWTKPEYKDLRFGFEVTMYINNK